MHKRRSLANDTDAQNAGWKNFTCNDALNPVKRARTCTSTAACRPNLSASGGLRSCLSTPPQHIESAPLATARGPLSSYKERVKLCVELAGPPAHWITPLAAEGGMKFRQSMVDY
ncbi:hypothetical protein GTA08_BOTSDO12681 [Botryosphaeria dothidea]|uniref:Uncharacterized protein n=1 Tax=Botryosphaeria dothidea TaxID=55169 RepID=A0A8H4NAF6_9PEZI|nr:hypothetical protein GTA08_BOTSDO12681 [Botryosphaeria dothidea]